MVALGIAIVGVMGAAVGSFLNVVIYRVPRGASIAHPRSSCPNCGAVIRPRDNVPLVSYAALGGRCRSCGDWISLRYPLVEGSVAALWVAAVLRFGVWEEAAFVAFAAAVLVAVAAIDLEHRRIPNVIVVPATAGSAVWILLVSILQEDWAMAGSAFASGAAGFLLLFVLALATGGIGFGDVKLVGLIGLAAGRFGWEVFLLALLGGFVIGGLAAALLLISGRRGRKDAIPFGPSLSLGGLIALYGGSELTSAWFELF